MNRNCFVVVVLIFAMSASAQTGPQLLIKPLLSEDETWESHGGAYVINNADTSTGAGNNGELQLNVFEYAGRFREQRERFIPRIGWEITYLNTDSTLPILDKDLTDVSIAAGVELGNYYDFTAGLTLGIGYAGDTPFGEGDAWYGKGTLVLGRKLDKQTDLAFVLDYDGNRTIFPDIPLPGVAYRHEFDPTLSYTAGVPFSSVTWKPIEDVTLEATWTLIDSFDAHAEYAMAKKWLLFGNFAYRHEAFHVEGLPSRDRLLFQQRRAELGVEWKPFEATRLLVAAGYAFGGEFSSGWDSRESDLVADVSDEPYLRIGFERRF